MADMDVDEPAPDKNQRPPEQQPQPAAAQDTQQASQPGSEQAQHETQQLQALAQVLPDDRLRDLIAQVQLNVRITVEDGSPFVVMLRSFLQAQEQGKLDKSCETFLKDALVPWIRSVMTHENIDKWMPDEQEDILTFIINAFDIIIPRLASDDTSFLRLVLVVLNFKTAYHQAVLSETSLAEPITDPERKYAEFRNGDGVVSQFGFLVDMFNAFGAKGGLQKLLDIAMDPESSLVQVFLAASCTFVSGHLPTAMCRQKFVYPLFDKLHERATNTTPKELRPLVPELVKDGGVLALLRDSKMVMLHRSDVDPQRMVDEVHLALTNALLRVQSFNANMYALDELKLLISRVNTRQRTLSAAQPRSDPRLIEVAVSGEELAQWMADKELLHLLFSDNLHKSSYVNRVRDIVRFIAQFKLTLKDLELIWQAQEGQHGVIVDNIHDLLAQLAYEFDAEQLDHLFRLVKASWGGTAQNMTRLLHLIQRLAEEDTAGEMAHKVMELVWSLAHNPDTDGAIVDEAISSMVKILQGRSFHDTSCTDVHTWLAACLEELKEQRWVVPAMRMTEALLDLFVRTPGTEARTPRDVVLNRLLAEGLQDAVLDFCEAYYAKAKERLAQLGDHEDALQDEVVFETTTHRGTMQQLHKLLHFIVAERDSYVTLSEATRLWHLLVRDAPTAHDRDAGLRWFSRVLAPEPDLDRDAQRHILEHELLSMDMETMPFTAIKCVLAIFYNINTDDNVIERDSSGFIQILHPNGIYQLGCLWELACSHSNETFANHVIKNLIDLFTGLPDRESLSVVTDCLSKVKSTLDEGAEASPELVERKAVRGLDILYKYLAHFDMLFEYQRIQPPLCTAHGGLPCLVTVVNKKRNPLKVKLTSTTTVGHLRLRVYRTLRLPSDRVQLSFDGEVLTARQDMLSLAMVGMYSGCTVSAEVVTDSRCFDVSLRTEPQQERALPSYGLASSAEHLRVLQSLLTPKYPALVRDAAMKILLQIPCDVERQQKMYSMVEEQQSLAPLFAEPGLKDYNLLVLCSLLQPARQDTFDAAIIRRFRSLFWSHFSVDLLLSLMRSFDSLRAEENTFRYAASVRALQALLVVVGDLLDEVAERAEAEKVGATDDNTHTPPLSPSKNSPAPGPGPAPAPGQPQPQQPQPSSSHSPKSTAATTATTAQAAAHSPDQESPWKRHAAEGAPSEEASSPPSQLDSHLTRAQQKELLDLLLGMFLGVCDPQGYGTHIDTDRAKFNRPVAMDMVYLCRRICMLSEGLRSHFVARWADPASLRLLTLQCPYQHVRRSMVELLCQVVAALPDAQEQMWGAASALLEDSEALRTAAACDDFFILFSRLVNLVATDDPERDLRPLISKQVAWLQAFCEDPTDAGQMQGVLAGRIMLTNAVLARLKHVPSELHNGFVRGMIDLLLFRCGRFLAELRQLQQLPTDLALPKFACDSAKPRVQAFKLLGNLVSRDVSLFDTLVDLLDEIHFHPDMMIKADFKFFPVIAPRKPGLGVGLKNASATCYMNSVVQQMFNQPDTKELLLGGFEVDPDEQQESVLHHVKTMFAHLEYSTRKYYTPKGLWNTYRHWGEQVNVREQQDACEFFNCLIDQVDNGLKGLRKPAALCQIFGGMFVDQKIIKNGCSHRYERDEPFTNIPITIRNCKTLTDALDNYVQGELLEGANAYKCEQCDAKRDTIKRTCIKTLPRVLALQLKRFDYDWERGVPVKFNDYFEFPEELDMGPYTAEGIAAVEDGSGTAPTRLYRLAGVVVHSGQANGGHYFSYIRTRHVSGEQSNSWFCYDDTDVNTIEFEGTQSMASQWFGGQTSNIVFDKQLGRNVTRVCDRWWSAYMLFYERADPGPLTLELPKPASGPSCGDRRGSERSGESREQQQHEGDSTESGQGGEEKEEKKEETPFTDIDRAPLLKDKLRVMYDNIVWGHQREMFNEEYFDFIFTLVDAVAKHAQSLAKQQQQLQAEGVGQAGAPAEPIVGSGSGSEDVAVSSALDALVTRATNLSLSFLLGYSLMTDEDIRGFVEDWPPTFGTLLINSARARAVARERLLVNAEILKQLFCNTDEEARTVFANLVYECAHATLLWDGFEVGIEFVTQVYQMLLNTLKSVGWLQLGHLTEAFELLQQFAQLGGNFRKLILDVGFFQPLITYFQHMSDSVGSNSSVISALVSLLSMLLSCMDFSSLRTHREPEDADPPTFALHDARVGGTDELLPLIDAVQPLVTDLSFYRALFEHHAGNRLVLQFACAVSYCNARSSLAVVYTLNQLVDENHHFAFHPYLNGLKRIFALDDGLRMTRFRLSCAGNDTQIIPLFRVLEFCRTQFQKKTYFVGKLLVWAMGMFPEVREYLLSDEMYPHWSWFFPWFGSQLQLATDSPDVESNKDTRTYFIERTKSALALHSKLAGLCATARAKHMEDTDDDDHGDGDGDGDNDGGDDGDGGRQEASREENGQANADRPIGPTQPMATEDDEEESVVESSKDGQPPQPDTET